MKRLIIVLFVVWAALLTPSYSQWNEAYLNPGQFTGMYFLDSLNGWFTHYGTDKIIHTSDGGFTFEVQPVNAGQYTLNAVYMEDEITGWSAGQGISGGPGIIHHTINGGVTWVQMNHPAPNSTWNCIAKVGNSIYFGGGYGTNQGIIMKTSDIGQNWEVVLYPSFGIIAGITVFDSLNYIVSGTGGLLSHTTDGGATWISANISAGYQVEKVAFLDNNTGYALATDFSHLPRDVYLYKTMDGGFTWSVHYTWLSQGQKRSMSVIPNSNTIFVVGYISGIEPIEAILKSNDGGMSWNTVLEVNSLVVNRIITPDQYHGWVTVSSYIYRYDYVTPVVVEPISNQLIQFGEQFTYQVNATGLGLKYSMTGNPSGLNIGLYSGLIDGTPTQGGKFDITVAVKDTDANVVNEQFRLKVNRKPHFLPSYPPLVANVDSMYQVTLSIEDLDDDTLSFSALQKPDFLELIPNPPSPIYTATIQGTPAITDTGYHNISIMVRDSYGGTDTLNWTLQVIEFIPPVNHPPEFIGNWSDTVYVFRDSSYTWNFDFQDLDGDTIWTIAENIGVPGMNTEPNMGIGAVTLTVTGIPADTGKYSAVVRVRDEHDSIGVVHFVVVVDIITGIDYLSSIPSEFVLYQNYPNSFNPSTKIKYSIPELSFVTLKIYDVLGNEICTLVNEEKPIGVYEVNWNAANITSGVYFYKLQAGSAAGGFIETKKMILMK